MSTPKRLDPQSGHPAANEHDLNQLGNQLYDKEQLVSADAGQYSDNLRLG